MDKLILGIGGMSKKVLKLLQGQARDYDMAVLDCWSRVQQIEITESKASAGDEDSIHIYFKRDLSFFITPPKVALRFDESMFETSETQKVVRDYTMYRQLLNEEYELESKGIFDRINSYSEIIIISPTSGWLPVEWLEGLSEKLQQEGTRLMILLICPLDLDGPLKREVSRQLLLAIVKMNVEVHVFYMQQFKHKIGNLTMRDFFSYADNMLKDGALALVNEEALSNNWQVYLQPILQPE